MAFWLDACTLTSCFSTRLCDSLTKKGGWSERKEEKNHHKRESLLLRLELDVGLFGSDLQLEIFLPQRSGLFFQLCVRGFHLPDVLRQEGRPLPLAFFPSLLPLYTSLQCRQLRL